MDLFEQLRVLQAAEGDPAKLALASVELKYPELPECERAGLKAALEAAAIPHWCDAAILAALLKIPPSLSLARLTKLRGLKVIEDFPARGREAVNVLEATRLALRRSLVESNPERFRELSARAFGHFREDVTTAGRIERAYHLRCIDLESGTGLAERLYGEWTKGTRPDLYSALALSLGESKLVIPPSTAAVAVSVAYGVLKLGQRLDVLRAEKQAVAGGLPLLMPEVYQGPSAIQKARELKEFLAQTNAAAADLLGSDHRRLVRELKKGQPDAQLLGECYARVFPDRLAVAPLRPDAGYVEELRKLFPAFDLSDPDCLAAAVHIPARNEDRPIGYGARVGLLVADVLAESGAQNTAWFVRNPGVRRIVEAVLERFAGPHLEDFTQWSPLLRCALSATVNGLTDAPDALLTNRRWLVALLDALAEMRHGPTGSEDSVDGLFQGQGYALLLRQGLGRAAEVLAEDQADAFKQLAADLLKFAAPLLKDSPSYRSFFAAHWGDLLCAGLQAFERHGLVLLDRQPELLREVLTRMADELKRIPGANLLSHKTLLRLGEAVIAAVTAAPELLEAQVGGQPWLRALLRSFVNTIAQDGIRLSFSREGLEEIVSDAAGVFATHPELMIVAENAGLVREVVGGILRAVRGLPSLDARNIATAAASGTLRALVANPVLMRTRYAELIANFCGELTMLVLERTLTGLVAASIASAAVEGLASNPVLLAEANSNLASVALNAVLRAAQYEQPGLLTGCMLVDTVREVLTTLTRYDRAQVHTTCFEEAVRGRAGDLQGSLAEVLHDSLAQVVPELGRRLDLPGVPPVIGGMVAAWARGDSVKLQPGAAASRELLDRLLATETALWTGSGPQRWTNNASVADRRVPDSPRVTP